jgi:hypothetical protein
VCSSFAPEVVFQVRKTKMAPAKKTLPEYNHGIVYHKTESAASLEKSLPRFDFSELAAHCCGADYWDWPEI